MTELTQDRRLVFYDAGGTPYRPVRDGASGRSVFKIKPKGAGNRAVEAIHTEEWLEVARAMLIDGLAARCKAFTGGQVNYLRFGAEKLVRYELDTEIAQALGISTHGTVGDVAGVISRYSVEQAMDAFDHYHLNGNGEELFSSFGNPQDYWVRSTRDRQNRVYPTKPLVGHILKKTELSGGWGQSSGAASRLHNAGFIIVDQNDNPIPPPERYNHLMNGADRIRHCALNYFIEPARERGDPEVTIRAHDLAAAIGLNDAFPNICQSLGGEKFQQLARVPPPTYTEPNPSSSTIFTYKLAMLAEADPVTESLKPTAPAASNLILYGPPGTGKTFHTAWEAVRLCLGDEVAASLSGEENRSRLMAEYRRLMNDGRIEFVTFHQSMSYEEFVEGLRPTIGTDANPEGSAGFRLEPVPGIFQRIAMRAGASTGDSIRGDVETSRADESSITEGREPNRTALNRSRELPGDPDFGSQPGQQVESPLFTIGQWPEAKDGSYRRLARDEATRLTKEHPGGFTLKQFQDALVRAGGETGSVPTGGWETHNMPAWASHPNQGWLVNVRFGGGTSMIQHGDPDGGGRSGGAVGSGQTTGDSHVLIIDEINRANISKVFGELITLLEPDKRLGQRDEIRLTLPYSKQRFGVPPNLHIIGTMNTADRSIALLDTALRRRFAFRELMPDPSVLSGNVDGINLKKLLLLINERIEYLFDREHQIGHAYFTGCRTRDDIEAVMRDKVIPLLAEYFYEDWSKVAAVLGDTRQERPRFLVREDMKAPEGMESDSLSGHRQRWRVKPGRDNNGNGGFDFTEFAA